MLIQYGVSSLPIDVFELACKIGIIVYPYSNISLDKLWLMLKKSKDGFFVLNDGQFYIFYNNENNIGRINYTIMHEIGHIVLDHSQGSKLAEKEANFFAKYILAPPVLIHKFNLKDELSISQVFNISFEAACYAYNYYRKWLMHFSGRYTDYEQSILYSFRNATINVA